MRWYPNGYGGQRRDPDPDPDQVKREGRQEQGEMAVSADAHWLTWLVSAGLVHVLRCLVGARFECAGVQ